MESKNVEITTQVIGVREESLRMSPVWVEFVQETTTLKDLICRAVEAQINDLVGRKNMDQQDVRKILDRHYANQPLTDSPRDDSPAKGKRFSILTETRRALKAVESGEVVIFIDGNQIHDLNESVKITPLTKAKFIRLIPLKGG